MVAWLGVLGNRQVVMVVARLDACKKRTEEGEEKGVETLATLLAAFLSKKGA